MLEIGSGLRSENCAKTIKYKKETEGEKELLLMGWNNRRLPIALSLKGSESKCPC